VRVGDPVHNLLAFGVSITYTFNMTENTTTGWPEVWNTDEPEDNLTPEQSFDILFGYAEERHNNDPFAHTKNLSPII
jgi:hypothetical protein